MTITEEPEFERRGSANIRDCSRLEPQRASVQDIEFY